MPTIEEIVNSGIDSVTDGQLRLAIRTILLTKNDIEIPALILEQKEIWKEIDPNQARLNATRYVEDTMNCFYRYFKDGPHQLDIIALKPDGAFARNMIAHFATNPGIGKYEMGLFCDYIANLSQKSVDIQKIYFDSFPPKSSAEIACLGGTGTRMTQLNQQLTVSESDKLLLDTHQLMMLQLVDRLKRHVPPGNHIHILPYLNFVFGVESKEELQKMDVTFICPQFSIPAHVLWSEMQNYAETFKALLKKRNDIPQKVEELKKKLSELGDISELISSKEGVTRILDESGLDKSGAADVGDLLDFNEEGEYEWSDAKLTPLILAKALPKIFNQDARKEGKPQMRAISLFGRDAPERIVELLNSDKTADVETGIEALWVLGVRTLANSQYQVKKVAELLEERALKENVGAKVSQLYQEKLDLALVFLSERKFQEQWRKATAQESFHSLIEIGAPTEDIKQFIASGQEIKYETLDFKRLFSRPDKRELLNSLREAGMVLTKRTTNTLLLSAMRDNDVEFASGIVQELGSGLDTAIFVLAPSLLIWSIESKDENLRLACNGIYKHRLEVPDIITGMCPIHYVVKQGSEATFDFLAERRLNLNALRVHYDMIEKRIFVGETPAHLAASLGKLSMIRKLKQYGAEIDQIDGFGMRPIHYAIKGGYSTSVEELITGGAKIHPTSVPSLQDFRDNSYNAFRKMTTIDGPDLLNFAARYGHVECLAILEKHGLEVDQKRLNSLAQTALNYGQVDMLKSLLERGASAPDYGVIATASSQTLKLEKVVLRVNGIVDDFVESGISEMDKAKKMAQSYRIFEDVTNSILRQVESAARETARYNPEQWNWLRKNIRAELVKTYEGDSAQLKEDLDLPSLSSRSFIPKALKQAAKIPTYYNVRIEKLQEIFTPLIGSDADNFERDAGVCLVPLSDKAMLREMVNIVEKPSVKTRTAGSARRVVPDNTNQVAV